MEQNFHPTFYIIAICCGIKRYFRMNGINVDIFKDKEFSKFHDILDSEMKRLQASGLGIKQRKDEVISYEDEKIMWQKGILGDGDIQSLWIQCYI